MWNFFRKAKAPEPVEEVPFVPVICYDCQHYRRDRNGDSDFAKCDMGEPRTRQRMDFVTGEMETIQLRDERNFCSIKNRDGRCKDFLKIYP